MTRRQEYIALAALVRAATGPDRQLDIAITTLIHQPCEWHPYRRNARVKWLYDAAGQPILLGEYGVPHYTRRLDDALTLALEYHSFRLIYSAVGEGAMRHAHVWDWRRSKSMFDPDNQWEARAATLPLALCSALLLARADAEGGS